MPLLCELPADDFLTMSGDYALIKAEEAPKVTAGGILLPDGQVRHYQQRRGVIVAIGPGVHTMNGAFVATARAVGQRVVINPMAPAMDVKLGTVEYFVVRENDIVAVIGNESDRHAPTPASTDSQTTKREPTIPQPA
jgi:co-chaperonin GroES (HSP10)